MLSIEENVFLFSNLTCHYYQLYHYYYYKLQGRIYIIVLKMRVSTTGVAGLLSYGSKLIETAN